MFYVSQIAQLDTVSFSDISPDAADASDHEGAARAIASGLARGHPKERPGYWLHTGGTGILCFKDSADDFRTLGQWTDEQYDDLAGVETVVNLPDQAFHRNVDKIVLDAGTRNKDVVKTVIVCPPTIYGQSHYIVPCRQAKSFVQVPGVDQSAEGVVKSTKWAN